EWSLRPSRVNFLVHGLEFDEGVYQQEGHIQVDLGLDSPFLQQEVALTIEAETRVRANVQRLVEFTTKVEKNSGANARLLWSKAEGSHHCILSVSDVLRPCDRNFRCTRRDFFLPPRNRARRRIPNRV